MKKMYVISIVIWIMTFSIIFGKMAMAECTGNLPIGLELDMPQADALRVMKMYGVPVGEGDVYTWNLDKTSQLKMVFKDYKLKVYEGSVTEKNTRKSFASFYNLFRHRVIEAYNDGYQIEFQLPLVVCYACDGKYLYSIEVTNNDGMLTFKRRWVKN